MQTEATIRAELALKEVEAQRLQDIIARARQQIADAEAILLEAVPAQIQVQAVVRALNFVLTPVEEATPAVEEQAKEPVEEVVVQADAEPAAC